jgi:hypothetical protein
MTGAGRCGTALVIALCRAAAAAASQTVRHRFADLTHITRHESSPRTCG